MQTTEDKKTSQEKSAEALSIYFEEANEVRAAHLLAEDLHSVRPDINKIEFYLIAQDARNGYDGKAECGHLGWKLKLKKDKPTIEVKTFTLLPKKEEGKE